MKNVKLKRILLMPFVIIAAMAFTLLCYAYFTVGSDERFNASVNIELLFDRLERGESGPLAKYQKLIYDENVEKHPEYLYDPDGDGTADTPPDGEAFNADIKWGSEYNPYVISDVRHLQNLSTLTNSGYFDKFFNTDEDLTNIPHFLVSTTEGKNVLIDATGVTIAPIGSDMHPFLGSVRGALLEDGTTEISVGDDSVSSSVIYNVTAAASSGYHDIGLFGYLGYTGTPIEGESTFEGTPSVIEGLVLADVKIKTTHSVIEDLAAWLDMSAHTFKIHGLDANGDPTDGDLVVDQGDGTVYTYHRETHHIGILAGHADYATIKDVSIYYSADDVCAIDITANADGANVNYYSHTGILGTLNHMNTATTKTDTGKSFIDSDGGISDENINFGITGGGGLLTGTMPGYILAANIFETYRYVDGVEQTGDKILLYTAKDKDGNPLCQEEVNSFLGIFSQNTGNYYFTDGVFTFALSTSSEDDVEQDSIEKIWPQDIPNIYYGPESSDESDWTFVPAPGSTAHRYVFTPIGFEQLPAAGAASDGYTYVAAIADPSTGELCFINLNSTDETNGIGVNHLPSKVFNNVSGGGAALTSVTITNPEGLTSTYSLTDLADYAIQRSALSGSNTFRSVKTTSKSFGLSAGYSSAIIIGSYGHYTPNSFSGQSTGSVTVGSALFGGTTYYPQYDHTVEGDAANGYYIFNEITYNEGGTNYTAVYYASYSADGVTATRQTEAGVVPQGASKVFFYRFEAPVNESMGKYTYNDENVIPADQYAFWPSTVVTGGASNADTDYSLVKLSDLNWKDMNGQIITDSTHTNHMFNMAEGVDWTVALNIGGFKLGTDGGINAPVGSDGTKYNIPTGCIAFKVGDLTNAELLDDGTVREFGKIRVIVAVPTSNTTVYDANSECFFGVWRGGSDTSSGISFSSFDRDDCYAKFEIPKSYLCDTKGANSNSYISFNKANAAQVLLNGAGEKGNRTVITPSADTTLYKAYLSGDVALVAYEFEIEDVGAYIMGADNSNMQIVYFSADGVASEGNDGTGKTGQLGSIDFVYSSNNKIIPVTAGDPREAVTEDTSTYYYPSYWLVHINNKAASDIYVNNERIYIRRYLNGSTRMVNVSVGGDGYVAFSPYNKSADTPYETAAGTFPNKKDEAAP